MAEEEKAVLDAELAELKKRLAEPEAEALQIDYNHDNLRKQVGAPRMHRQRLPLARSSHTFRSHRSHFIVYTSRSVVLLR